METKEMKIIPPEGYEIDESNSTFECIKFKKKALTYEDVARELFIGKRYYYIDFGGDILPDTHCKNEDLRCGNLAASEKQLEKLLAINKLMNLAKYLNGSWKPDWNKRNYFITINSYNTIIIDYNSDNIRSAAYFSTGALAKQAIDILGEDTIRLALSTDW